MTSNYTDLSGIFYVEQALLNDISHHLNDTSGAVANTALYQNVISSQSQLDQYNSAFQKANQSTAQVLDRQVDVDNILTDEFNRLQQKQMSVDNALEGRRRGAFLNDNYRQRYAQYTKIVFTFIITLVIIYVIDSFKPILPFPEFLVNAVNLMIIFVAIMICYYSYMTILWRDNIYFDELKLAPPDLSHNYALDTTNMTSNPMQLPNFGFCIDSNCCDTGTTWDKTRSTCVVDNGTVVDSAGNDLASNTVSGKRNMPSLVQGFTTLDQAYIKGDVKEIIKTEEQNIGPNDANEFNDYTVYN